jgi:hypothetical protein
MALEMIGDPEGAPVLYKLLQLPGVTGYSMPDIQTARSQTLAAKDDNINRTNSLRELFLARALYRCGDLNGMGKEILTNYSNDLRSHYSRHAREVLRIYAKSPDKMIENNVIQNEKTNNLPEIKSPAIPVKSRK